MHLLIFWFNKAHILKASEAVIHKTLHVHQPLFSQWSRTFGIHSRHTLSLNRVSWFISCSVSSGSSSTTFCGYKAQNPLNHWFRHNMGQSTEVDRKLPPSEDPTVGRNSIDLLVFLLWLWYPPAINPLSDSTRPWVGPTPHERPERGRSRWNNLLTKSNWRPLRSTGLVWSLLPMP